MNKSQNLKQLANKYLQYSLELDHLARVATKTGKSFANLAEVLKKLKNNRPYKAVIGSKFF